MLKKLKKIINQDFLNTEITKINKGDLDVVVDNKKQISEKISHAGALKKYSELAKILFAMLKDYKKGIYKQAPWFSIAAIAVSLLYILNPFDIVPDFIPGIGYVDDLAVFTIALRFIQTDLQDYLDWKIGTEKGEGS